MSLPGFGFETVSLREDKSLTASTAATPASSEATLPSIIMFSEEEEERRKSERFPPARRRSLSEGSSGEERARRRGLAAAAASSVEADIKVFEERLGARPKTSAAVHGRRLLLRRARRCSGSSAATEASLSQSLPCPPAPRNQHHRLERQDGGDDDHSRPDKIVVVERTLVHL